jgi:2-oxoglutarate ferredoxin oxidoreductase subunit alpha
LWPFAGSMVREMSSRVRKVFVPEMNMGQVVEEVMKYISCDVVRYNQMNGQIIHPDTIVEQLRRLL